MHIITATTTTPGRSKYQEAYQSKRSGIYNIILIVEDICSKHNIQGVCITDACAGIEDLEKSMDPNTKFSCLSNHVELISAIDYNLR